MEGSKSSVTGYQFLLLALFGIVFSGVVHSLIGIITGTAEIALILSRVDISLLRLFAISSEMLSIIITTGMLLLLVKRASKWNSLPKTWMIVSLILWPLFIILEQIISYGTLPAL